MLYSNEITIIFNVVNSQTKTILGNELTPHILRIPKDSITTDVDTFLETYTPLLKYVKTVCVDYESWKYGTIEYYNIQEDIFENVVIKKIIPAPENIKKYAQDAIIKILEQALSKFNILNTFTADTFEETKQKIYEELQRRGMSKNSVNMYVQSISSEKYDTDIQDIINKICPVE